METTPSIAVEDEDCAVAEKSGTQQATAALATGTDSVKDGAGGSLLNEEGISGQLAGKEGQADIESSHQHELAPKIEDSKEDSKEDAHKELNNDLFIAEQEAVKQGLDTAEGSNAESSGGDGELERLRRLVLLSRGSKAQLPPGWEEGGEEAAEAVAAARPSESQDDAMVDRAIAKVGAEVISSNSESEDSDSSSSEESSSSDSASESSDSEDEGTSTSKDGARKASSRRGKRKPQLDLGNDDEDDGGEDAIGATGPTTKNEVIAPTVDQPPFQRVPEDTEVRPLGKIHSIVDCVVVVSQDTGRAPGNPKSSASSSVSVPVDRTGRSGEQEGEYSVLDTGSLLALEDRNVLGVVYETFGSVLAPLYALRFASAADISTDQIALGKAVWYVPSHSTYVLTRALRAMGKGSDASNIWDEEIAAEEQEFSDDEQEAEYKRNLKASKGKGKKRPHGSDVAASGPANPASSAMAHVRHALPARPTAGNSALLDSDLDASALDSRSMPLPYDDMPIEGPSSALAPIAPSNELPPLHFGHSITTGSEATAYSQNHGWGQRGASVPRGRGRGRGRGSAMPSHMSSHQAVLQGQDQSASSLPASSQTFSAGAYNPAFRQFQLSQKPANPWQGYSPSQQQSQHAYAGGYGANNAAVSGPWSYTGQTWQNTPGQAPSYQTLQDAGGYAGPPGVAGQTQENSDVYDPSQPQMQYPHGWFSQQQH